MLTTTANINHFEKEKKRQKCWYSEDWTNNMTESGGNLVEYRFKANRIHWHELDKQHMADLNQLTDQIYKFN